MYQNWIQTMSNLWDDCIKYLPAKERLTVSEFSEKHRWLYNEGGGHVGKWDNDKVPYLIEPMNELDNIDVQTIVVVGPGQSGKTTIGENWLMRSVHSQPGNFLWYMQTDDSLEAYVKSRIDPMVKNHGFMTDALGYKTKDNSLHFKNFTTMTAEFLSGTYSNLINKSAPRILADEIDAYPETLGNVYTLLNVRRQTFGKESKILITSHPDRARGMNPDKDWTDGVMGVYSDSDRRMWYWKCPHCNAYSSPNPLAARYMCLSYPEDGTLDEVQEQARLICPVNGCLITDKERLAMNATGKWVGTGQKISVDGVITGQRVNRATAGFWVVGVMCPFLLGGIGILARQKVKAEREYEVSGENKTLKEVMVKQLGFPYTPPRQVGSVSANELAARCEDTVPLRTVPRGARFLTAGVDIQNGYFDVLVRGWGMGGESWIVDKFRVNGDTATDPQAWDQLIDLLLTRVYDLEGIADKGMPIRGIGYDLSGAPGVSQQGYDAWRRWRKQGITRMYGEVSGREAWSVLPTKGASQPMAKKLTVNYPDTSNNKDRAASRGDVPVAVFNPNFFKDDLNGQLQRADDGPWYVHFPMELRPQNPPFPWFEQLVSESRDIKGRWDKINKSARNEALDLMVMTHVIAHLHGISEIKWERPPLWAAEWHANNFLVPIDRIAKIEQSQNLAGNRLEETVVKIVMQKKPNVKSFIDMMP
jgi:phage terminase large subunit GpA-like protein